MVSEPELCLKAEVRRLLNPGKKNTRTGIELAKILGYSDDRSVRLAIRELIAGGLPVASSVSPPFGYFIASSLDEATDYIKVLKSRLVEDAYRRRDFKLAARDILEPCQQKLF